MLHRKHEIMVTIVLVIALLLSACQHVHDYNKKGRCKECDLICTHEVHDSESTKCLECNNPIDHYFENGNCSMCDKTTIFEHLALEESLHTACDEQGTVEHLTYLTHAYALEALYGEEILVEKELYVYLPYGYDPSIKYNVLYLLHGGGGDAGYWFAVGNHTPNDEDYRATNTTINVLDNIIKNGICEPLIVVTPTFYVEADGYDVEGADLVGNFGHELKNEIMPLIAETYATYAASGSHEDLIAARDHQAYAGLSMGSMTSFQSILSYCTDYISYIGSYSAGGRNLQEIADTLNNSYAEYPIHFWFNGNGTEDQAHDGHIESYQQMLSLCPNVFQEGINCAFADKHGHGHLYASWIIDLYNSLLVFF